MHAWGKSTRTRLPLAALLVLLLCALGLALHPLAEGLSPAPALPADGSHPLADQDPCEDDLLSPVPARTAITGTLAASIPVEAPGGSSFCLSPLLPPPDLLNQ